jgi:hypothetical protein
MLLNKKIFLSVRNESLRGDMTLHGTIIYFTIDDTYFSDRIFCEEKNGDEIAFAS